MSSHACPGHQSVGMLRYIVRICSLWRLGEWRSGAASALDACIVLSIDCSEKVGLSPCSSPCRLLRGLDSWPMHLLMSAIKVRGSRKEMRGCPCAIKLCSKWLDHGVKFPSHKPSVPSPSNLLTSWNRPVRSPSRSDYLTSSSTSDRKVANSKT